MGKFREVAEQAQDCQQSAQARSVQILEGTVINTDDSWVHMHKGKDASKSTGAQGEATGTGVVVRADASSAANFSCQFQSAPTDLECYQFVEECSARVYDLWLRCHIKVVQKNQVHAYAVQLLLQIMVQPWCNSQNL